MKFCTTPGTGACRGGEEDEPTSTRMVMPIIVTSESVMLTWKVIDAGRRLLPAGTQTSCGRGKCEGALDEARRVRAVGARVAPVERRERGRRSMSTTMSEPDEHAEHAQRDAAFVAAMNSMRSSARSPTCGSTRSSARQARCSVGRRAQATVSLPSLSRNRLMRRQSATAPSRAPPRNPAIDEERVRRQLLIEPVAGERPPSVVTKRTSPISVKRAKYANAFP